MRRVRMRDFANAPPAASAAADAAARKTCLREKVGISAGSG
jgi:hypothetical protein